jgi:hypothetical protein
VELTPPSPFLWDERWRFEIRFRWFIEKQKKDGSLLGKTYIVESRLIFEKMAQLEPAEEGMLHVDREENSGGKEGVSSSASTCSTSVSGDRSTVATAPTATETISNEDALQTLHGFSNTLAASDRTNDISKKCAPLHSNEFEEQCIFD